MHQGNLFVQYDGTLTASDFGIMGRIDRRARAWLAEILYGLTTGNYRRVAEIHFEAQYVPGYHSVEEFATALRAVGEPMRGKPVAELSVGQMLDGLFAITSTEEHRVGKECVSACRSRVETNHKKKKNIKPRQTHKQSKKL